ncbi:MAG TPA: CpsD/CapB family tyrosine-protein kinase [Candidatus Acidoferrales bacterium]|nr:CpsD/CapB family tyrosine-protein kinase [Candidatus Acidoferrales bacterium]
MSRIFDALRKSERDRAGDGAASPEDNPQAWRELASAAGAGGDHLDQAPVIRCQATNGRRPAATWHGAGQETFRVLHHRLELLRRVRPLKKLLITSAIPKEGKTTIAVNLAVALARSSPRVLLIDADLRHPGVHRSLGLPATAGLADWLEHRAELGAVLRRVEPYRFFYLSSGQATTSPGEMLRQRELREFLAGAGSLFDWVLIDSPPLVSLVDAHYLATLTDGVLMVLRQGVTPRAALEEALGLLDRAFVAGAVLNGASDGKHSYYGCYDWQPGSCGEQAPATNGAAGGIPHG